MSNQKPRTIDEQIRLLRSRGMAFGNEEKAKQCLAHISYFRLKYYWTDMQDEETEHDFKEGARLAEELGVKNLILYHTEDRTLETRKERYTAEAHKEFAGQAWVPNDLEKIML